MRCTPCLLRNLIAFNLHTSIFQECQFETHTKPSRQSWNRALISPRLADNNLIIAKAVRSKSRVSDVMPRRWLPASWSMRMLQTSGGIRAEKYILIAPVRNMLSMKYIHRSCLEVSDFVPENKAMTSHFRQTKWNWLF